MAGSGSSDSKPISLAGEWGSQHVYLVINPDGTALLDLNAGCCVGVQFALALDLDSSPVMATIVSRSLLKTDGFQPLDEDQVAMPGDVLMLDVMPGPEGDLLVITMPESEQNFSSEITVCRRARSYCGSA